MIRVCYKAENCVDFLLLMTHCPGECVISVTSPSRNGHKQTEIFTLCQNLNGNKHFKKEMLRILKNLLRAVAGNHPTSVRHGSKGFTLIASKSLRQKHKNRDPGMK